MNKLIGLLLLFTLVAGQAQMPETVVAIANANEGFNILVASLTQANMVDALGAEGPFTVFAPNDEAFEASLTARDMTPEMLLSDEDLGATLSYHVVPGKLLAADVTAAVEEAGGVLELETLGGPALKVEIVDGAVVLNGATTVLAADLEAGNGVVHVIDSVLTPPVK